MSFWDMFRINPSSEEPCMKSKKELVVYLKNMTGNDVLAALLGDVFDHIGRDGYIEVRKGGSGNPFHVAYQEITSEQLNLEFKSSKELREQIKVLKERLVLSADHKKEFVQKEIARLAGAIAMISVNVESQPEFEKTEDAIKRSVQFVQKH